MGTNREKAFPPSARVFVVNFKVHRVFFSLLEQVESPIVEYCEGLVTQAGDVQHRALQVYSCQTRYKFFFREGIVR